MKDNFKLIPAAAMAAVMLCAGGCGLAPKTQNVQDTINALPAEYTLNAEDSLQKSKELYGRLSVEEKKKVDTKPMTSLENSKDGYLRNCANAVTYRIEEFNTDYTDLNEGLTEITAELRGLIALIKDTPTEADKYIDYTILLQKQSMIAKRANRLYEKYTEDSKYSSLIIQEYQKTGDFVIQASKYYESLTYGSAYLNISYAVLSMEKCLGYFEKTSKNLDFDADKGLSAANSLLSMLKAASDDPSKLVLDEFNENGKIFLGEAKALLQLTIDISDSSAEAFSAYKEANDELFKLLTSREKLKS